MAAGSTSGRSGVHVHTAERRGYVVAFRPGPSSATCRLFKTSRRLRVELLRLPVRGVSRTSRLQRPQALEKCEAGPVQDAPCGSLAPLLVECLGAASVMALIACPQALADDVVPYNPAGGEETLKTVAGVGYIILVSIFFFRLFRKRAKTATSQPFASTMMDKGPAAAAGSDDEDSDDEEEEEAEQRRRQAEEQDARATPLNAFIGAAQAGVICYLLFQMCGLVDSYFAAKQMPEQYTAYNVTVLLQTVVRGLAYLITFIFGANAVGLTGLMIQLLFFPELDEAQERARQERLRQQAAAEQLPRVNVTDDLRSIRQAFKAAEREGAKSGASRDEA